MRIGIDIRKYYDFGIGTYTQNLVNAFQDRTDLDCVYFAPDNYRSLLPKTLKGEIISDNSPKYSLRELISVSKRANSCNVDLFHAPHYTLPINLKMPGIVTVHDIIHLRLKEYYSFPKRSYAYLMIKHACSASSAIIVDSEFGKKELLKYFRINDGKIHVVPLGVNKSYFTRVTDNQKELFLRKYSITKPFILYTGSLKPHKNVPMLLRAFKKLLSGHNVQMVFTGEKLSEQPQLIRYVEENRISGAVIDLGRIDQTDLKIAYQSSTAVVLPSLYEGFGFSMLEAMASGVPAIGARATSITEVVGDAGLLFDSSNEDELVQHLNTVLTDQKVRTVLIDKGTERAHQFSWKQCADRTVQIYQEVVQ